MLKCLKHLTYKEGLGGLGLSSLNKGRLRGILSRCLKAGGDEVKKMKPGSSQWC